MMIQWDREAQLAQLVHEELQAPRVLWALLAQQEDQEKQAQQGQQARQAQSARWERQVQQD
ncbi:hypothetical protein J1TS3_21270 [Siminovitchia fordii]|uniref:Uncharacterized protein n=1 Tax=Siminovitchia fordii TaxID=254759 RepID=A0ABQ4K5J6_9BACI|nr:hypothetical protein J1TS3_21270 [Siminovitchia fordii]